MRIKRNVILSHFAVALTALCATTAQAVVNVQLNLFYNHPADPNEGGTWDLLVQSGATNGMGGMRIWLDGITGVTGIDTPIGAITPNAEVFDDVTSIFGFGPTGVGTEVEIIAGDDLVGALITGVGTGAADLNSPGNIVDDDLFLGGASSGWNNSALIASGTFGDVRPTIILVDAVEFADPATNPLVTAAFGLIKVRGDSEVSLGLETPSGAGLLKGDANRDGIVGPADVSRLSGSYLGPGGWADGDFDNSGTVGPEDVIALSGNFGLSVMPPAIGAVPEPASLTLLMLAAGFGMTLRRRV